MLSRGSLPFFSNSRNSLEPDVDALVVGNREVVRLVLRVHEPLQAGHRRHDVADAGVLLALGLRSPRGELAVAAHAHAGARAGVPDVAVHRGGDVAVRVAHLAAALAQVAPAAAAVVGRPDLLDEVGGIRAGRVRVAVVADLGVDVEVVEQHELPRDGVGVRRDLLAEQAQVRVAVAPLEVAEDLVVGAVLADDVEDVLDGRRIAHLPRDRRGASRRRRREHARARQRREAVDGLRHRLQRGGVRHRHDRQRALQHRARILAVARPGHAGAALPRGFGAEVSPLPLST